MRTGNDTIAHAMARTGRVEIVKRRTTPEERSATKIVYRLEGISYISTTIGFFAVGERRCQPITARPLAPISSANRAKIFRNMPRTLSSARLQILGAAALFSTGGAAIKVAAFSAPQVSALRSGIAAIALVMWL